MDSKKGKSITTSVPSISIKFHANAEQIEELYASDDEKNINANEKTNLSTTCPATSVSTGSIVETEGSPLKFLRLGKRSTSAEVPQGTDSSPPSDPWRFFSDIKGKITKSVEDKITEIKAKKQEEGSPFKSKPEKFSRDNSSLSDSEELSESSISKTCGIISTTEGVEMSSDEETPAIEKDKRSMSLNLPVASPKSGLHQRFRLLKSKSVSKEGTVSISNLSKLYNINSENVERALPEHTEEVENAIDALEDVNFEESPTRTSCVMTSESVLKSLNDDIENIEVDDESVLNIKEVIGSESKPDQSDDNARVKTVFAPIGFFDFRNKHQKAKKNYLFSILLPILTLLYYFIQIYSTYVAGIIAGIMLTAIVVYVRDKLTASCSTPHIPSLTPKPNKDILEIPAVKEYQPILKYEGWVNEYPDTYNPITYHISQTQSVYLRLQGSLLRISHTVTKISKRAMWNEPTTKVSFNYHRIYNLLEAKIHLLPMGLTKIRHWSKKYPICITLNKDQLKFDDDAIPKEFDEELAEKDSPKTKTGRFGFRKKKPALSPMPQLFSKLAEEQENVTESELSRSNTSTPDSENFKLVNEVLESNLNDEPEEECDNDSLTDGWSNCTMDESPTETKIYLFGRTDREKEDWFRRLTAATHFISHIPLSETTNLELNQLVAGDSVLKQDDYIKYMSSITKVFKKKVDKSDKCEEVPVEMYPEMMWMNMLLGRVLFDCMCDATFTVRLKERIQRKLAAIKLPYFIEELIITELNLGRTAPILSKPTAPVIDERGLWVDSLLSYEGLVVLTLMTKLNLMKLKNPHDHEKDTSNRSAMFHSDVDDSAESSSDDDSTNAIQNLPVLDAGGNPTGPGAGSNASKKFIKMVDRIAESKLFQAATDNKYIKKAMEGVSNTDLRLKVEIRALEGTLVLNVPPPPSDRIWVGFRPTPELLLSAQPIVGERNITFMYVTSWIEKKLIQEFQKILVIPNMEDFIIPVMISKLPE